MTADWESRFREAEAAYEGSEWMRCIAITRELLAEAEGAPVDRLGRLWHLLAQALLRLPGDAGFEEAVRIYEGLLDQVTRPLMTGSQIHMALGLAYQERTNGVRAQNLTAAVQHYEEALRRQEALDSRLAASIRAEIAYALNELTLLEVTDRDARLERSRQHLSAALAIFRAAENPSEFQEVSRSLRWVEDAQGPALPRSRSDTDPSTASLTEAAEHGCVERVIELLDQGADINATDQDGCTALQLAVAEGFLDLARLLVARGANQAVVDKEGFTLLHWAVLSGNKELIALSHVPERGLNPRDRSGRTPLSWAVTEGSLATVEWLLVHGADPDCPDLDGWTPLHYAAARGNTLAIRHLAEGGASLRAQSTKKETPLEVALRLGQLGAATTLRELGC